MLATGRRSRIVEELRANGTARVSELAVLLSVSEMTIRRDVEALEETGLLEKVHGGAQLPGGARAEEPGFDTKLVRDESEKNAIAQEAAALVSSGSAIGLGAGTTTWTLAKHLWRVPDLTVVTNSPRIADVFHRRKAQDPVHGATVILTGGERTLSDALVGPIAISALGQLHLDLLFLGAHGVDEKAGFTTPNLLEAETNRAFSAQAQLTAVLADHTKWGKVGMSTILPLSEADVFVSDDGLAPSARETLSASVGRVLIATMER